MRNRFNGSRRGRRPGSFGSVPGDSSPYDFTARDEDGVEDPVDMLSIRADDEMLDALASGLSAFAGPGGRHAIVGDRGLDDNINDDQQMLALLAAWRDEVRDEPIPELISVEDASRAIVAGHRSDYPRRRLVSVAAAAAAVVVGMSGVALGAGSAKPGDTLWGVSKALNSDRASSVEAAQQVSVTLASVRQALAEGHVAEAQAKLASIAPVLDKVTDQDTKTQLSDTQANLAETVETAKEGEKVKTDDSGKRDDDHDSDHGSGHGSGQHDGQNGHDPRSDGSQADSKPDPRDALRSEVLKSVDPRFSSGQPGDTKPEGSTAPDSAGTGSGNHGPGSTADPRRTGAPSTTEPKPSTKPTSGPRPSKWNPPPRKTTPPPDNTGGNGGGGNNGAGNNGAGGSNSGNNGGGGNSQQGQNKPDGQHKAQGEGEPADSGTQGQPAAQDPPAQPGPRPVPPGS